jgi:hypothetical protein
MRFGAVLVIAFLCGVTLMWPRLSSPPTLLGAEESWLSVLDKSNSTVRIIKECNEHRLRWTNRLQGPATFLVVTGHTAHHDRTNVAIFLSSCEKLELVSLTPPDSQFVGTAGRICSAASSFGSGSSHLVTSGRELVYILYATSRLPGQSLAMMLDSVGCLLSELISDASSWSLVTIVVQNYTAVGMELASQYVQMLSRGIHNLVDGGKVQFRFVHSADPLVVKLVPTSSLMFASPLTGFSSCQLVGQALVWQSLNASLTPQIRCRICILLKTNSAMPHHTPLFFSVAPLEVAETTVLAENISKYHRLWLLNHADVIIDSAGANGDINRLLLIPRGNTKKRVCWITLVHPDSHLVSLCQIPQFEPVPGYLRKYLCPRSARFDNEGLIRALKSC